MAYTLQQFGRPVIFGLAAANNDACILSSFSLSYTAKDVEHVDELGRTCGYTSYDMGITWDMNIDIVNTGTAMAPASTLALTVGGLGAIPGLTSETSPTLEDVAQPLAQVSASGSSPSAYQGWKAYCRTLSTSGSRDGVSTASASGNFWPF